MNAAGTLLGGRVRYTQPKDGFRTGIEPVLLAACIPARPGEIVVEGGTGAGPGLLCLHARVPGLSGIGVEIDQAMAAIAAANFAANGVQCTIITQDLGQWTAPGRIDHAFANPPWHEAAGTPSPQASRARAKIATGALLAVWARALARDLRPRGSLSLILPAARLAEAMAALTAAGCPEITVFPLWPRAGTPAKLLILQGFKGGKGPCHLSSGLTLHEPNGDFTPAAQAILKEGAALNLS